MSGQRSTEGLGTRVFGRLARLRNGAGPWDRHTLARHRQLASAVPFPKLVLSCPKERDRSLEALRNFAETLAYSEIDWYLHKKRSKKFLSLSLRYLYALFAIVGALVPLVRIFSPEIEAQILRSIFGSNLPDLTAISAELALVLIGVAAGLNIVDRLSGASTGWSRYITTAIRIHERLLEFYFDWDLVELKDRNNTRLTGEQSELALAPIIRNRPAETGDEFVKQIIADSAMPFQLKRFYLGCIFCLWVVQTVGLETTSWVSDFTSAAQEFEQQLGRLDHRRHP